MSWGRGDGDESREWAAAAWGWWLRAVVSIEPAGGSPSRASRRHVLPTQHRTSSSSRSCPSWPRSLSPQLHTLPLPSSTAVCAPAAVGRRSQGGAAGRWHDACVRLRGQAAASWLLDHSLPSAGPADPHRTSAGDGVQGRRAHERAHDARHLLARMVHRRVAQPPAVAAAKGGQHAAPHGGLLCQGCGDRRGPAAAAGHRRRSPGGGTPTGDGLPCPLAGALPRRSCC